MPRAKKPQTPPPAPSFKGWIKDGIGLLNVDDATKDRYRQNADRAVDGVADGLNRFEKATNDAEAKLKQGFADFRSKHFGKK